MPQSPPQHLPSTQPLQHRPLNTGLSTPASQHRPSTPAPQHNPLNTARSTSPYQHHPFNTVLSKPRHQHCPLNTVPSRPPPQHHLNEILSNVLEVRICLWSLGTCVLPLQGPVPNLLALRVYHWSTNISSISIKTFNCNLKLDLITKMAVVLLIHVAEEFIPNQSLKSGQDDWAPVIEGYYDLSNRDDGGRLSTT